LIRPRVFGSGRRKIWYHSPAAVVPASAPNAALPIAALRKATLRAWDARCERHIPMGLVHWATT
jgi:hypothetical protein